MLKTLFPIGWTLFNLAGIFWFLVAAVQFWPDPDLIQMLGASATDPIGWYVHVVPILNFFAIFNLLWLLAALAILPVARWWRVSVFALLIGSSWVAVFLFDNAHHGI